jgi:hypothetical protein
VLNTGALTVTAGAGADLAITITAPSNIALGADLPYVITVTNNGPQDATGVVMTSIRSWSSHRRLAPAW